MRREKSKGAGGVKALTNGRDGELAAKPSRFVAVSDIVQLSQLYTNSPLQHNQRHDAGQI